MKLLFVFTGGTIGSTRQGEYVAPDQEKPYLLPEAYRARYGISFSYDCVSPYSILSEQSTGETLHRLCACIAAHKNGGYDGIIVAHGTDTLQYTAAALSYAFSDTFVPICIVSSNHPITTPSANGLDNLRCAVRFIGEVGAPGVFVCYRNGGEPARVHRASRLLASQAFSDRVESIGGVEYGSFTEEEAFSKNPLYAELSDAMPALGVLPLEASCAAVLRVQPYPGMSYPALSDETRYILHESYHCGTLNTESREAVAFFAAARERGIPVFLTGADAAMPYASKRAFSALGIRQICGIAPIAAFVKLWMLHTADPTGRITEKQLQASLAGDRMP